MAHYGVEEGSLVAYVPNCTVTAQQYDNPDVKQNQN